MMTRYLLLVLLFALAACDREPVAQVADQPGYNIDAGRISVSGVSSGAYMAGQLHLAHSAIFGGVGIVAGGPYYCAMNNLSRGLGPCLKGGEIGEELMVEYAREAAAEGKIDDLANLSDDHAWIFHGALDVVVDQGPSEIAAAMYAEWISDDAVIFRSDVNAVHGLPTLATGMPCDSFGAPFLNRCNFDAAGEILKTLHGELIERAESTDQVKTIVQPGFDSADMLEHAFLYVPASCAAGELCGIHVAIHGCSQSAEYVGDAFATGAGFNQWAESNHLLVLYPQVASSEFAPMNPFGCWDWWGYTNEDYATKKGPQVMVIKSILDGLAGTTL